jgi:hypothetical protein
MYTVSTLQQQGCVWYVEKRDKTSDADGGLSLSIRYRYEYDLQVEGHSRSFALPLLSFLTWRRQATIKTIITTTSLLKRNTITIMHSSLLQFLAIALVLAVAHGFTVVRPAASRPATMVFSSEPEEEEGFDLDLGEMFQMFDAADKEEDFDEAVKKVKGAEN